MSPHYGRNSCTFSHFSPILLPNYLEWIRKCFIRTTRSQARQSPKPDQRIRCCDSNVCCKTDEHNSRGFLKSMAWAQQLYAVIRELYADTTHRGDTCPFPHPHTYKNPRSRPSNNINSLTTPQWIMRPSQPVVFTQTLNTHPRVE